MSEQSFGSFLARSAFPLALAVCALLPRLPLHNTVPPPLQPLQSAAELLPIIPSTLVLLASSEEGVRRSCKQGRLGGAAAGGVASPLLHTVHRSRTATMTVRGVSP